MRKDTRKARGGGKGWNDSDGIFPLNSKWKHLGDIFSPETRPPDVKLVAQEETDDHCSLHTVGRINSMRTRSATSDIATPDRLCRETRPILLALASSFTPGIPNFP